ncbi:MAG: phosphoribosylformylglycinamidine cyclo-ligase [Fimbriimonadaceae bacterium]|nr:phosphoribosylformylglycinamidine cyclo-ligase [Fimbriimonadaceae bacterium]
MSRATYAAAGVDIDAQDRAIALIKDSCRSTYRPEVATDVGSFGGLWALDVRRYREPLLVSSIDGVGTKLYVAIAAQQYRGVGRDLVNHCLNDIAVMGAEPLFFLDYYATGKLAPEVAAEVIAGLAEGCRAAGCALIGGELAEMPGLYQPGDFDLAGCIVGVVERSAVLTGATVQVGDAVVGLPSCGLHTNGYSLARRLLFELAGHRLDSVLPELAGPLGEVLLAEHRCYLPELRILRERGWVKAAAHITGGGLLDNLPRVLPAGCGALLRRATWTEPPIFGLLQRIGAVADDEMDRTFNRGLGMLLVVPAAAAADAAAAVAGVVVGEIVPGEGVRIESGG